MNNEGTERSKTWRARKVVIVGAGQVGATFAYALAQSGVADEIVLVDLNAELAQGQVLDLSHGRFFFPSVYIHVGNNADYADAQVIVVTAGASQKPGESRLDLLQKNARIMRSIVDDITAQDSSAVLLVVSNPVDILTYVAQRHSGWPAGRVMGSGTVLDSARLRYQLSQHCNIDVHNVHAYILGEHGDSEFAAWSMVHLAGLSMDQYCPICGHCGDWEEERRSIEKAVRNSAYHVIDYKGATYYAVGLALVRIVGAILRNEHSVLTVSTVLDGEYGLSDVALSVPCIVSQEGIDRVMETTLPPEEDAALRASANILKEALAQLEGKA
ncbi:MAG: L-lactate dehydrogenase [Anaerolineae bacterium]|nr:L-lactate dehydrogenase [Anaerolineae bacterium]